MIINLVGQLQEDIYVWCGPGNLLTQLLDTVPTLFAYCYPILVYLFRFFPYVIF